MIGKLSGIVLDTPDVKGLAAFYGEVAGVTTSYADDDWVSTVTPQGWKLSFQRAADHQPPRWPDQAYPQQFHMDLLVPDLDSAVDAAVKAGATKLPGGGDTWTVLADPSGHPFCLCYADGVDSVQLGDVCLDAPDAKALAQFYSQLLSMDLGEDGVSLSAEGQPPVLFQEVENYNAPQWPDPAHPQQYHLDVLVEDIDAAERQALALGAKKLPGGGDNYRVYADTAGHPFCLCW